MLIADCLLLAGGRSVTVQCSPLSTWATPVLVSRWQSKRSRKHRDVFAQIHPLGKLPAMQDGDLTLVRAAKPLIPCALGQTR